MFIGSTKTWIHRDIKRWWPGRNSVTIGVLALIALILIRQLKIFGGGGAGGPNDDDATKQYLIPKEEKQIAKQSNLRVFNSFGEGPKAGRPEYHWEDHTPVGTNKIPLPVKDKLKRQYDRLARPLTEKETYQSLRNLTFYKKQEVQKELETQPYTYIQQYERGYQPRRLRIMIENITQTTFEELNRDLPEIGSVSVSTESSLSKLTSWLVGGGKQSQREETVLEQKKNIRDLIEERTMNINNANRGNFDITLSVISSDNFAHGNMVSHYEDAMNTLLEYAKQNDYKFQIIDPQPIIDKYGTYIELLATELKRFKPGDRMKIHKSLVMLYTLRKKYYEFENEHTLSKSSKNSNNSDKDNGRRDTWIVFLDADVMIANPHYRIEDIIHHTRVALRSSSCEVISQLSLSTINTGVMMFRVSQISDILIQDWIQLIAMGLIQTTDWQHEQGWFEYLYLLYLQRYFYSLHPFVYNDELDSLMSYQAMNCGFRIRKSNQHIGVRDVPLAVIRGRCFMKSLSILDVLPIQYDSELLESSKKKSVFAINRLQKELHMCMLTGLEMINPMSPAISSIGFFNMHDWSGEDRFIHDETGDSYVFQILDSRMGELKGSGILSNPVIDIEADGGMCGVAQPLFYHGKNETTRTRLLHRQKKRETQQSGGTEAKLRPVSRDGSCTRDLIHLLRSNAADAQWLSYGWQKKVQQFNEVKTDLINILSL